MSSAPRISVLILNYNGRRHLETCLPSLCAQVYPKGQFRIEVIDNGSTDDSLAFVRERYPQVLVHRFDRNRGFAPPYDEIVRGSSGEFVALLNNDTRVEPTWLAELADAAERHQAHCVASRILDWDGRRIDFVGGLTSFIGHSWQRDHGEPAAGRDYDERPLLFACGGSMLISREAYVDAGGFDTNFFAYFEDVDLGWRLSLLGYRTVLAPRAVTYHRLHGTATGFAYAQRLRLYERNALAMLYKNYEDETLRRVLPAAVSLSLLRGLAHSGLDARLFAFGAEPPPHLGVNARTVSHLLALEDFGRWLPALNRVLADIQRRRRLSDRDLVPLFGDPFRLHETGPYEEVARTLIRDFDIESAFAAARPPAVPTPVPPRTADPVRTAPLPRVSVIILTTLWQAHLEDCLASLRAQTYPAHLREIVIVDNAAATSPAEAVRGWYPGATVLRSETNVGFTAGNNIGARAATGEFVVFLNDDTRVHPAWLYELVGTALRRGAASVGSRILSWDGATIDFAGASVNCEGKGFQVDIGTAAAAAEAEERPLLFGCGAATLVRRDVFLETGGFDEGAFAYYEDVELGWRLWLLGHEVWYSPRSIVYHKHHGSWGRSHAAPRLRLYERNSLRILYTLLERETLERVLPAALLLASDRALLATGVSRASGDTAPAGPVAMHGRPSALQRLRARTMAAFRSRGVSRHRSMMSNLRSVGVTGIFDLAGEVAREASATLGTPPRAAYDIECGSTVSTMDDRQEPFPVAAAAALSGVHDFLDSLPRLTERRARLQQARRRSDREIIARFDLHWLSPCGAPWQQEHERLHRDVVQSFEVEPLYKSWTGRT